MDLDHVPLSTASLQQLHATSTSAQAVTAVGYRSTTGCDSVFNEQVEPANNPVLHNSVQYTA